MGERVGHRRPVALIGWMLRKAAGAVFVLWAVATIIFFALRMVEGDPAQAILGGPGSQASAEAVAKVRADYGLDQPLIVQYGTSMLRLVTGDLGNSYALKTPVAELIADVFGGTLLLTVLSLVTSWILAIATALWTARGGRIAAATGSAIEVAAASVPQFWLASLLILIFSSALGWVPPISIGSASSIVLPVLTLALPLAGFLSQVMRHSLAEASESPFALSARARGESEIGVTLRHTLRHAALPAVSLSGWAFGSLLSGAVVVETIFARPGLGRSLLSAVTIRDIPMVTGIALVAALTFVVVTAVTDLIDRTIDPRVRGAL